MLNIFRGDRPDITPAMLAGIAVAGIPIVANLLRSFGVYDVSEDEQKALADAVQWGAVSAAAIIAGDSANRWGRNASDGKVQAAALAAPAVPHDTALPVEGETGEDEDDELDWDVEPDADALVEEGVIDALAEEPLPAPVEVRPSGERAEP